MSDLLNKNVERGTRFIYGRPEVVEAELANLVDTYACTGLFYYVVDNHLEVAATLLHMREVRRAQLLAAQMPQGMRRQ